MPDASGAHAASVAKGTLENLREFAPLLGLRRPVVRWPSPTSGKTDQQRGAHRWRS
jgi:hypothetical protein